MIIHKIKSGAIEIDGSEKIIRKSHYEKFLSAQKTLQTIKQERVQAEQENSDVFEEMKQRGYEDGLAQAKREALAQHIQWSAQAIDWTDNLQKEIFIAIKAMLDKIVGTLDKDEITKNIIGSTLKHYARLPELKILVAPQQKYIAKAALAEIAKEQSTKFISIEADERLSAGDCVLESPLGSVDASLDIQLKQLKKMLDAIPLTAITIKGDSDVSY